MRRCAHLPAVARDRQRRAFTLLELLVAITVLILLIVLLASTVQSTASIWQHSEKKIDAFREARAALHLMRKDLSRIVPANGLPALTTMPLFGSETTEGVPESRQIFAFTTARNKGLTDVCLVGYFCRWNPEVNGYELIRYFADSDETFARLQDIAQDPQALFTPEEIFTPNDAPEACEKLAAVVWNLSFKIFDAAGREITAQPLTVTDGNLPASIEVSMDVISPKALRAFQGRAIDRGFWAYPTSHLYIRHIAPSMQSFTTRIPLDLGG